MAESGMNTSRKPCRSRPGGVSGFHCLFILCHVAPGCALEPISRPARYIEVTTRTAGLRVRRRLILVRFQGTQESISLIWARGSLLSGTILLPPGLLCFHSSRPGTVELGASLMVGQPYSSWRDLSSRFLVATLFCLFPQIPGAKNCRPLLTVMASTYPSSHFFVRVAALPTEVSPHSRFGFPQSPDNSSLAGRNFPRCPHLVYRRRLNWKTLPSTVPSHLPPG